MLAGQAVIDAATMAECRAFLTIADVAQLLGVGRRSVERWASTGLLPGKIRIARTIRFHRGLLLAWLESGGADGLPER